MSEQSTASKPESTENAGTVEKPLQSPPPARPDDGVRAALLDERRKRQDLEQRLADYERAEAEKRGEYQELATRERERAEQASARALRLERALALTDAGITDPEVREYALWRAERDGAEDFDGWLQSTRDQLAPLLPGAESQPEPEPEPRPTGTRTGGKPSAEIPDHIIAEAARHGMDPERWYQIRQRADERAKRKRP